MDHCTSPRSTSATADRWAERQGIIYADMAALQPTCSASRRPSRPPAGPAHRCRGARGCTTRSEAGPAGPSRQQPAGSSRRSIVRRSSASTSGSAVGPTGSGRRCWAARRWSWPSPISTTHPQARNANGRRRAGRGRAWSWLATPAADADDLVGDFNAAAGDPTYAPLRPARVPFARPRGKRRASPTHRRRRASRRRRMDTDGDPGCLDYIWVRGDVASIDCRARLGPARSRTRRCIPPITLASPPTSRRSLTGRARPFVGPGPTDVRRGPSHPPPRPPGRHAGHREHDPRLFLAAMAKPSCDGLEFDVRQSRDGVPVLIHDATLQRVQGRPEAVADLSAAELEASACRRWRPSSRRSRAGRSSTSSSRRSSADPCSRSSPAGADRTSPTRWSRRSTTRRSAGCAAWPAAGRCGSTRWTSRADDRPGRRARLRGDLCRVPRHRRAGRRPGAPGGPRGRRLDRHAPADERPDGRAGRRRRVRRGPGSRRLGGQRGTRMTTERADLVIVGAGIVGGWATPPSAATTSKAMWRSRQTACATSGCVKRIARRK